MSRELRNDGPEVAEACDHCTHPWTEHHLRAGCTRDWISFAAGPGCMCRLAHTGVISA